MFPEEIIPPDRFDRPPWVLNNEAIAPKLLSVNHTNLIGATLSLQPAAIQNPNWKKARAPRVPQYVFTQACYFACMLYLSKLTPEKAGVLFGPVEEPELLTSFRADTEGKSTSVTFELDREFLNKQIKAAKDFDLEMKGIVHSHPSGFTKLSRGDRQYLETLFGNPANHALPHIFMPIVCGNRMHCYAVTKDGRVHQQPLVVY